MTKIILFDEKANNLIPGIIGEKSILELPIWGNYRFKSVVDLIFSRYESKNFEIVFIERMNIEKSHNLISKGENVFISRVSSPAIIDLEGFKNLKGGVIKLRIGKVPSDFYYLDSSAIRELDRTLFGISSVRELFSNYLFNSFEKIVDVNGYSFRIRNVNEYYEENMNILRYLKDEKMLAFLSNIPVLSEVESYVSGVVKNSYIAPGSKIFGKVINSVIFEGVEINKGCYVESSVILPGNKLEEDVVVKNSLILGGESRIIGSESRIGNLESGSIKVNHPFPLKRGLTVVGENITIPENSYIGASCVVWGKENPDESLKLKNGEMLFIE